MTAQRSHDLAKLLRVNDGYAYSSDGWLVGSKVNRQPVEPEASTQPLIRPTLAILHSNAAPRLTPWSALVRYWRRADVTGEAHFQVDMDGTLTQAIPVERRADCNYKANRWWSPTTGAYHGAVSFETQDNGAASLDVTPWTVEAVASMVAALVALVVQYGAECGVPTSPYGAGIGHHVLYREWSIYKGKTCPGAARIRQMDHIRHEVALRVAAYLTPDPSPSTPLPPLVPAPWLREGSRGEGVALLQARLAPLYASVVDGWYGPRTTEAVKRFQAAQGLVVDGVYGPQTAAALARWVTS